MGTDRHVEIAFGQVIGATNDRDAGVVDENVVRTERRCDVIDQFSDGGSLRYVGRGGNRTAAHVLDLRDNRLGLIGAFPIVDRDGSTGFGQRDRNRSPNAARGTRHQRNVAG